MCVCVCVCVRVRGVYVRMYVGLRMCMYVCILDQEPRGSNLDEQGTNIWSYSDLVTNMGCSELDVCRGSVAGFGPGDLKRTPKIGWTYIRGTGRNRFYMKEYITPSMKWPLTDDWIPEMAQTVTPNMCPPKYENGFTHTLEVPVETHFIWMSISTRVWNNP